MMSPPGRGRIASSDRLYEYWGKARRTAVEGPSHHLLAYHCLDVAAVADAWWRLNAPLRAAMMRSCGVADEEPLGAWLLYFCALHDLGKWDVRFQLQAPEIAKAINPGAHEADRTPHDHGRGGYAAFLDSSDVGDNACLWMQAVAGHHGTLPNDGAWRPPTASERTKILDRDTRAAWLDFLGRFFLKPARADLARLPSPPEHLAGFCCVCDWLGSDETFFPWKSGRQDLTVYFSARKEAARRCLEENGLIRDALSPGGMGHVFQDLTPRGVQESVEEWPLAPGITLIEAPTGTGKTEAALAYASRLLAAGLADGVIFALPTQATANAMLPRLEAAAGRLFDGGANIVLAHGRARYNAGFMRLQESGLASAQGDEDASAQCSRWLASSRKKVFLGQIGVCTIDQVLLSVLPLRHYFVRAFGLHKSVLIVDEVHAYDSYMNGLLDKALGRHRRAGGSAILLSATLDAGRRRQILRLWESEDSSDISTPQPLEAYPLVSHAGASGPKRYPASSPAAPRRVEFQISREPCMRIPESQIRRLAEAASGGARAVLICNLVADAQEAARQLDALGAPVDVFHSRFRFCDRQALEKRILDIYGKHAPRDEGKVLVATQVVEQSLDLDFDWMVTQLCPVDLLFQRVGRLHRHPERQRPQGFDSPRCTVIASASLDFGGHQYVYANARALWRTQQLIMRNGEAVFPAAYREWIEDVYAEAPWPDEPAEIARRFEEFRNSQDANRACAMNLVNSGMTPLGDSDGVVTALTRDGEMAASVIPLVSDEGTTRFLDGGAFSPEDPDFDESADRNSIPVPAWWAEGLPGDEQGRKWLFLQPSGKGRWKIVAGSVRWSYDVRYGLERRKNEPAA